jgi:hypothetical protein
MYTEPDLPRIVNFPSPSTDRPFLQSCERYHRYPQGLGEVAKSPLRDSFVVGLEVYTYLNLKDISCVMQELSQHMNEAGGTPSRIII